MNINRLINLNSPLRNVVCILLLSVFLSEVNGETPDSVGYISYVEGDVSIVSVFGTGPRKAGLRTVIEPGDVIELGANGYLQMQRYSHGDSNSQRVRFGPGSKVRFGFYGTFELNSGTARFSNTGSPFTRALGNILMPEPTSPDNKTTEPDNNQPAESDKAKPADSSHFAYRVDTPGEFVRDPRLDALTDRFHSVIQVPGCNGANNCAIVADDASFSLDIDATSNQIIIVKSPQSDGELLGTVNLESFAEQVRLSTVVNALPMTIDENGEVAPLDVEAYLDAYPLELANEIPHVDRVDIESDAVEQPTFESPESDVDNTTPAPPFANEPEFVDDDRFKTNNEKFADALREADVEYLRLLRLYGREDADNWLREEMASLYEATEGTLEGAATHTVSMPVDPNELSHVHLDEVLAGNSGRDGLEIAEMKHAGTPWASITFKCQFCETEPNETYIDGDVRNSEGAQSLGGLQFTPALIDVTPGIPVASVTTPVASLPTPMNPVVAVDGTYFSWSAQKLFLGSNRDETASWFVNNAGGNTLTVDPVSGGPTAAQGADGSCGPCVISNVTSYAFALSNATHGVRIGAVNTPYSVSQPPALSIVGELAYVIIDNVSPLASLPAAGILAFNNLVAATPIYANTIATPGTLTAANMTIDFGTGQITGGALTGSFVNGDGFTFNKSGAPTNILSNGTFALTFDGTCGGGANTCGGGTHFATLRGAFVSNGAAAAASWGSSNFGSTAMSNAFIVSP